MRSLILAIGLCFPAVPALAGEYHDITETQLRALSDSEYIALIFDGDLADQAYTPEQIASGLRRHYQERRARMIDVGFTIKPGPCS